MQRRSLGRSNRINKHRRGMASSTQPRSPAPTSWVRFSLAAIALALLVLIAYSNSLDNGFVWDDHQQVVLNPGLKPGAPLLPLFSSDLRFAHQPQAGQTREYRPLQLLTYRIVLSTFGPDSAALHGCSVLFAILGALAAFAMFWLLTHRFLLSWVAAALFAVHPIHTEAVDWIAALPDLGLGLFILLTFTFFLAARRISDGYRRTGVSSTPRWLFPGLSLLAYATALLWKETAVVFPLLVAFYVLLFETEVVHRLRLALRQSAPYWAILAAYLLLRFHVLGALPARARYWSLSPFQFFLTALHLLLTYCAKLAVPIRLNAYYSFSPIRSLTDPRTAVLLSVVFLVAGVLVWKRRALLAPRAALGLFATLWVLLPLLPALDLAALGRNPFTERYLYLPSAGFCLGITLLAAALLNRLPLRVRVPTGAVLLLTLLAASTAEILARNPDWKDDARLFSQSLRLSPDSPFLHYMVAVSEADASQPTAAEQEYLKAVALARQQQPPDLLDELTSYQGLAWIYADRAQYDQALALLAHARELAPANPDTSGETGLILARAGRGAEAEPLLREALTWQPDNENVLSALGLIAWQEHKNLAQAVSLFSRTLAIHTQDDDFSASEHNNLGGVYGDQENFPAAVQQFRLAVGITPADPEYRTNLASALAAAGRYAEARAEAETVLRITPGYPAARQILNRLATLGKGPGG